MVDETDEWKEDGLTGRGFDDGRLANSGGIEIDIGTFFGRFFFDVEIEKLDDIADEVW